MTRWFSARRPQQPGHRCARRVVAIMTMVVLVATLGGCSQVQPLWTLTESSPVPSSAGPRSWLRPTSVPMGADADLGAQISFLPGVQVAIMAGSGLRGGTDGPGREAQFDGPMALALDHEGYLLVAEYDSGRIRLVDQQGFVRSWIGEARDADLSAPSSGPFDRPTSMAVSTDGASIYVLEGDSRLMAIRDRSYIEQVGGGNVGFADGDALQAAFRQPLVLATGAGDSLYISDSGNHRLRMFDPSGGVYTLAGSGVEGYGDGPAVSAQMAYPHALAIGPQGQVYVGDGGGWSISQFDLQACIRMTNADGELVTVAGGAKQGYVDGAALDACFRRPLAGVDVDDDGNVYVADTGNHAIRVLTPQGEVFTLAGNGVYGLREGDGTSSMLGLPLDLVWDGDAGLYVADYGQQVIWRIDLSGTTLFSD